MRVDQYLPVLRRYSSVGNHTRMCQKALREAGFESEIWAESIAPELETSAYAFDGKSGSVAAPAVRLYQWDFSSPITDWLERRAKAGDAVLAYYHNLTPTEFFAGWDPELARDMVTAREQLSRLAPHTGLAFASSAYSRAELMALGYEKTVICPPFMGDGEGDDVPDTSTMDRLRALKADGGAQWLFVGRIAPNKCQLDLVRAFAEYRRAVDPSSRMSLVGGVTSPAYRDAVMGLISGLDLEPSVEVVGPVTQAELLAYYRTADVFVCLSEHEGFCIPVVEAMEHGVPVVAYGAAAVPETVGDAGILLSQKDPAAVVQAVVDATREGREKERRRQAGYARARGFSSGNVATAFTGAIAEALSG